MYTALLDAGKMSLQHSGTMLRERCVPPSPARLLQLRRRPRPSVLLPAVQFMRQGVSGPPERTGVALDGALLVGAEAMPRLEAADALSHFKWAPSSTSLTQQQLWHAIQAEAREVAATEPVLASFAHMTVIMHDSMARSLAFILANKLQSTTLLGTQLTRLFVQAYEDEPALVDAAAADLQAVYERDPACENFIKPLLFFKGYQAIQAHRVSHWMWQHGRKALAVALQSRMSEVFGVDIHPGAKLGWGVMMDHATGIVIGETTIVGDNVSMLHHVTLGGSGTGQGVRHPVIGNGVLLGAGVSVLGAVVVGHCSKIGAGSVVASDLPPHVVAVGVPAKVIKRLDEFEEPVKQMDQVSGFILDYVI